MSSSAQTRAVRTDCRRLADKELDIFNPIRAS
ncbi:MAG: hypothetical protein H6Q99_180 [Proteobacteria bacterium]|nr:hypothetical protein [Pseudomonadota bacterium]